MNENSIVELRDPKSSQDTATKNYVDRVTLGPAFNAWAANAAKCTALAYTKVPVDTTRFDTDGKFDKTINRSILDAEGKFDKTLNRFKPSKPRYYFVNLYVEFKSALNTYYGSVHLYKTGIISHKNSGRRWNGASYINATGSTMIKLATDDYIEIFAQPSISVLVEGYEFSAIFIRRPT